VAGLFTQGSLGQAGDLFIDPAAAGLGEIADVSLFGYSVASIGDVNGDGFEDLAVGIPRDDSGGPDRGAVAVVFLGPSGTVVGSQKISVLDGGFAGPLANRDGLGTSVAGLGDLDGDGISEIAVGAPGDDDGGFNKGAVWILFLNGDGTVKTNRTRKISDTSGGFGGVIEDLDAFGLVVGATGDINGDGSPDLAVGMPNADDGRFASRGFVWILLLRPDGSVLFEARVEPLVARDRLFFGSSVGSAGDVDGDGIPDLAIGATGDDGGGRSSGNVVLALMDEDGTARSQRPVFTGLNEGDQAGGAVAFSDGGVQSVASLVVGSAFASTADTESSGAVWQVILDASGRPTGVRQLGLSIFGLSSFDRFGGAVDRIGDLNGDGLDEWVVGASGSDAGGFDRGGVWLMFGTPLPSPQIASRTYRPDLAVVGEPITIVADVTDVRGVARVEANLRRGGESSFFTSGMSEVSPGKYELTIPSVVVGPRGVEYFVSATNNLGVASRSPALGYESIPIYVPGGDSTVVDGGDSELSYRLFSVPLDLDDKSARSVLEPDLGPYSVFDWRFYDYSGSNEYVELDEADISLVPGRAYWLLLADASRSIRIGAGRSIPTDIPFSVPLRAGWTLVGNPFDFPVPLHAITMASGRQPDLWAFREEWLSVTEPLPPFGGYAVSSADLDTLVIDPRLTNLEAVTAEAAIFRPSVWAIQVSAHAGDSRDAENFALVTTAEPMDPGSLDRAEPPFVGDYVAAFFEGESSSGGSRPLSTQVRTLDDGPDWVVRVETARPRVVTVEVHGLKSVPAHLDVVMIDAASGRRIDVRRTPRFSLGTDGSGEARLRLLVQPGGVHEVGPPSHYSLLGAFPNPSSSDVEIRYSASGSEPVKIRVFDLIGRQVATLETSQSQQPGESSAVWDGRGPTGPVASGLYVVTMEVSGQQVGARPLVRVR
jgi:hypothetical protein